MNKEELENFKNVFEEFFKIVETATNKIHKEAFPDYEDFCWNINDFCFTKLNGIEIIFSNDWPDEESQEVNGILELDILIDNNIDEYISKIKITREKKRKEYEEKFKKDEKEIKEYEENKEKKELKRLKEKYENG